MSRVPSSQKSRPGSCRERTSRIGGQVMTPSLLRALGIRELYGQNVIRVNFPRHGRFQEAERLFHLANAIDEDPKRFVEAACLYRTCVKLDPSMHAAYTHPGCVYFRHGQPGIAEVAWRKDIEIDTAQPCPHFNLGYSAMCKRWNGVAAGHFRRALDAD